MKHLLAASLAAVALAACQQNATVRDTSTSDVYTQLNGSSLVLKQNIDISPGKARVFVQDGTVSYGFDSYRPHCAFEINSVNHEGFPIEADTFVVERVQSSIQQVVSIEPVRVAALMLAGGMDGGGSQSYYDGYHFWLSSVSQPEVRRMSCYGVYAEPYELYPPTMEEIRGVLGSLAEIRQ